MKVFVSDRSLSGKGIFHTFELEVRPDDLISTIIDAVVGRGLDGELVYAGKRLSSFKRSPLANFGIQEGSTFHVTKNNTENTLPWHYAYKYELNPFIETSRTRLSNLKKLAAEYDFDDEAHIIEPEAHSEWLTGLEDYVFTNSELKMGKGRYDATNEEFEFFGAVNIPDYMMQFIRLAISVSRKTSPEPNHATVIVSQQFMSLLKSYLILTRILQTLDNLVSQGFATSYYSFFLDRPSHNVAELKSIDRSFLLTLQQNLEVSIQMLADSQALRPWSPEISDSLNDCLLPILLSFLDSLCDEAPLIYPDSDDFLPRLCRVTVLLCDLALVSYVGSHGSRFDEHSDLEQQPPQLAVSSKAVGVYSFRCDLRHLTCLDGLLDSKQVWVFRLNLEDGADLFEIPPVMDTRLSVVTTMERMADIWGPVRALFAPGDESKIIQYHVSNGVVRRSKSTSGYKNAIACHWEDWSSYYGRAVSSFRRLIVPTTSDHFLSPGDLLLIGEEGYRPNDACTYTLSAFKADYKDQLRYPGTKPAEWKSDSRNAVISFSKFVGMSLGLTQKRIPQTTVKEHTWNTWTSQTKRQNPIILQRFSGVEISHCTGNAKKVPLKTFFQNKALVPQFDLQFPRWRSSSWGRRFLQALDMTNIESFLSYWKRNEADRAHVTELFIYLLDLLSDTGASDGKLKALLAQSGEEYIVPISISKNSWAAVLEDTHLAAVYVAMRSSCMECAPVSPHSKCSQCESRSNNAPSYTMLYFQAEVSHLWDCDYVIHDVSGKLFKVDKEETTDDTLVLTTSFSISRHSAKTIYERKRDLEGDDEWRRYDTRNVYIRSSAESFGGMSYPRSSLRHLRETWAFSDAVQQSWNFGNIQSQVPIRMQNGSLYSSGSFDALPAESGNQGVSLPTRQNKSADIPSTTRALR